MGDDKNLLFQQLVRRQTNQFRPPFGARKFMISCLWGPGFFRHEKRDSDFMFKSLIWFLVEGAGFEPTSFGLWAYCSLFLAFCAKTVFGCYQWNLRHIAYTPALETIVILETDLKTVVGSYTGKKWSISGQPNVKMHYHWNWMHYHDKIRMKILM